MRGHAAPVPHVFDLLASQLAYAPCSQAAAQALPAWSPVPIAGAHSPLTSVPQAPSSRSHAYHGGRDEDSEDKPDVQGLMDMVQRGMPQQQHRGVEQPPGASMFDAEARRVMQDPTAMLMMGRGVPFGIKLRVRVDGAHEKGAGRCATAACACGAGGACRMMLAAGGSRKRRQRQRRRRQQAAAAGLSIGPSCQLGAHMHVLHLPIRLPTCPQTAAACEHQHPRRAHSC